MSDLRYLENFDHAVYVMWVDETPVYVGMTCDWHSRLKEHGVWNADFHITQWTPALGRSAPITHIDVWELNCTRTEARAYEREAIRALLPTHNRQGFGYRPQRTEVPA